MVVQAIPRKGGFLVSLGEVSGKEGGVLVSFDHRPGPTILRPYDLPIVTIDISKMDPDFNLNNYTHLVISLT